MRNVHERIKREKPKTLLEVVNNHQQYCAVGLYSEQRYALSSPYLLHNVYNNTVTK